MLIVEFVIMLSWDVIDLLDNSGVRVEVIRLGDEVRDFRGYRKDKIVSSL